MGRIWGYWVFEFTGNKLKAVGNLDVSVPGPEDGSDCTNATQHMAVKRVGGWWSLTSMQSSWAADQKTERPSKGRKRGSPSSFVMTARNSSTTRERRL